MKKILALLLLLFCCAGTAHAQFSDTSVTNIVKPGSTGNSAINRLLGTTPQLPHWNKALAKVMSGQGNARVLCLGDSTFAGQFSNNTGSGDQQPMSACGQLTNILNNHGIYASNESAMNPNYSGNTRFTTQSGWGSSGVAIGGSVYYTTANSATQPFFTPRIPIDTFKLQYLNNASNSWGVMAYSIDGGSFVNVNESVGNGNPTLTISAGSVGFHTITFKWVSGGSVGFTSIEAYDSTKSQVIVYNGGWLGSTVGSWLSAGNPWEPGIALPANAYDLVIINLQINDMVGATPLSTYKANLKSLVALIQGSPTTDVVFLTSNHVNPSASGYSQIPEGTQLQYAQTVKDVAATISNSGGTVVGVPVIDEFQNFVSWNFTNTYLGAVVSAGTVNDVHMNYFGYALMARDMAQVLIPAGNGLGSYSFLPQAGRGTFVCTSGGTITITNALMNASSTVDISLNTAGGTISTPPAMKTVTAGTGFTVLCATLDTSTYNYAIMN